MSLIHRKEPFWLFLGDICILIISLVLTLLIRYGSFPTIEVFETHIAPFSILFIAFILVNFIAGLYEKHTILFKNRLPITLLNVQIINTGIGVAFFYFIPYFSISPKLFLFIYLLISLVLMSIWRMFIAPGMGPRKTQKALLIGDTNESEELYSEVNNNSRYHMSFIKLIKPSNDTSQTLKEISDLIESSDISMVVVDTRHPKLVSVLPGLYKFAISGVLFFEVSKMYEAIFDRIPLSLVGQSWFVENMSSVAPKFVYDIIKRSFDLLISFILLSISLILYPFVILALKIEGNGSIFSYQNRVGQYNKIVRIIKFRTMTIANDNGKWGSVENKVTRVGSFLRKTRIDELPQLWNVLRGDVSLIGPRPEFPDPVLKYAEEIPYYNIRHVIKPGLSGWAQIYGQHPHHGIGIDETRNKLSYDLYYIKHRSFLLDLKTALRTVKVLITFVGR
jgi:exopolysaccharide biosynthesis polyprenyl glycosylphosphotransferase